MKPTFNELQDLYVNQKLTTRQIGKMLNVSKTSIKRWLESYQIPLRPSSKGLLYRGIVEPTYDELYQWVHVDHLSYEEIAIKFSVDSSAVRHWLIKHDIPRPKIWDTRYKGNPPVMPTEEVLRDLYEVQGFSIAYIAEQYGVKSFAMRSVMRRYNIAIKHGGWNGKHFTCKDGHVVRSIYEQRIDDWLYEHGIDHIYEPPLPFDKRYHADFYAKGYYIEMWGVRKNKNYDERRKHKIQIYKQHNLPLLQIDENRMTRKTWEKVLNVLLD